MAAAFGCCHDVERHGPRAGPVMISSADPTIDILSAGAVKTLLAGLADAFQSRGGGRSQLTFDTAPAIARRIEGGERHDVLAAPAAVLSGLSR